MEYVLSELMVYTHQTSNGIHAVRINGQGFIHFQQRIESGVCFVLVAVVGISGLNSVFFFMLE